MQWKKNACDTPWELICCKGWECTVDAIQDPAKNILGHYFCNHRNVWNAKMSRLDEQQQQQQDTQKRESGNQIKHN